MVAITAILTKILGSASKAGKVVAKTTKVVDVGKKIGGGVKKVADFAFNNTVMFFIIFGYLVYSVITGGTGLFHECLAPIAVGGVLAVFFGGFLVYIVAALCIGYKVLVEPFNTVYYRFISVEHLSTHSIDKYEAVVDRIATLEPFISLIATGAYIFLIIAIIKHDKAWIYKAGKVLLIMILIGMATNAGIYFYDILFIIRDWFVNTIASLWS